MKNLSTICAVSMMSAATLFLAGCPEEGVDKDKTTEEAKPAAKDDKTPNAEEKKEGDTQPAAASENAEEKKDEKKDDAEEGDEK